MVIQLYLFVMFSCGDTERLTNWTCESCAMYPKMKVHQVFQSEDTGGYGFIGVDESQHKVVISFRGTLFSVFETVFSDLQVSLVSLLKWGILTVTSSFGNQIIPKAFQTVQFILVS